MLAVAFRRATIEHMFRVVKTEAGLAHYEGRQYVGLVRHLIPGLVLGFVSIYTDCLRGNPQMTMEQVCRAFNARCAVTFRRRRGTSLVDFGRVIRCHQQ